MAKNNLKPEVDLVIRDFFEYMQGDPSILGDSPARRRSLLGTLVDLLGYKQLPNGAFVSKDLEIKMPFGSSDYSRYPDEYAEDKEKALEATSMDTSGPEASASEPSEDTEVREAVLSEDV